MSVYETFDEQKQFACRVIADHARTTAFSIADGILPGNEGRNYVLRKIMRRAIYHGREHLGLNDLFFYKVCDFVVDQMKDAFPELETQREFIGKMVRLEEERFGATMTVGLKRFEEELSELISIEKRVSNIVWDFEKDLNSIESETAEIKNQHEINFGSGDIHQRLARLVYKYRIPPYLVLPTIEKIISEGKFKFPEGGFSLGLFASALYLILRDEDNEENKKIAELFINENPIHFLNILDTFFSGHSLETYPNFRIFAKNYDTFGTPRDLIRVLLEDRGIAVEEEYFNESFDLALAVLQQQSGIGQTQRKSVINPIYHEVAENVGANQFHGYDVTQVEDAKVIAIVKDDQRIENLGEGEEGLIILSETPFYAESGGQIGDTGFLINETTKAKVQDTFAPVQGLILHKSKIEKGSVKVGDVLTATVDAEKRDATRRNHTATHLVHAALKEVLGTHVKQAGSVVAPNYLRFDFTHYQPISSEEIREIENLVNHYILQNEPVTTNVMAIEEAMSSGAVALFGEKYGANVRVLSVGGGTFSKELCGGTHVRATGDIGSFKITADEAVASGVRRIRAITGFDAFERFREDERLIEKSLGVLRTQRDQLPTAIEKLQEELRAKRREVEDLKMKIATGAVAQSSSNGDESRDVSGVKVVAKSVEGLDKGGMRHLSDTLLAKLKTGVVILARTEEEKVSFIVRVSDDLTDRVKAGKIVQEIAPIVGGRGGGKADMAEGGGTDAGRLNEALEASYGVVEQMLN